MQVSFTTPPEPFRAPFAQRFRLAAHPTAVGYLPWAAVVLALVSFYYVFLASAGRFTDLKVQADYFDRMAEGFRAGHLYLRQPPPRELIVASNPFDHQFRPFWLWDASLYRGHFYLYWSPVPALALLAYKVVTQTHDTITDQWVTTALMVSRLCAGAGLISTLASRARLRQPTWLVCLAIAVFGLANPLPFVVARPHIYEGTLCGAQGFLFWGMLAAFWGLELPRRRRLLFALASGAWALAAGCRPTAYVAVPCLVAISVGFAWRGRASWKESLYDLLALGVPFGLAACANGVYNYLRFDSVTEFGFHYQLTLQPFFGRPAYVLPNVYSYLFEPVGWSCRFPFVHILGNRPATNFFSLPTGYQTFERVGGILLTTSWCWLAAIWGWQVFRRLASRTRRASPTSPPALTRYEVWASLCGLACLLTMVPVLTLWEASMRYVADATGALVLLGTLAAFRLVQEARQSSRAFELAARGLVVALGVQTCVVGAFAAFTAYDDPMKNLNPSLYEKLDRALSLCDRPG